MISGNNVKLLPIESNDENFLTVYSAIRTVTSDDTQFSRRSISIDMPVALKTKINSIPRIILSSSAVPRDVKLIEVEGNDVIIKNLRSGDPNFIDVQLKSEPSFINSLGVSIDLNSSLKLKLTDLQTVQLEPGAAPAKRYPAVISGTTVNNTI